MPDHPYRFWSRDPFGRSKPAIVAETPAGTVEDGVATVRLYDPIDSYGGWWGVSAKEFQQALDSLGTGVEQIQLHINSPGGEVYDAIAIKNALRAHPARVTAVVDGLAASAASFIAVAADELVMGPHTELMIHDAWGITWGDAAAMREYADRLDAVSTNIASIYAAKAGGTTDEWRTVMIGERWYSAQEAVDAGLADRVDATETDAQARAAASAWDLSLFRHQGASTGAGEDPAPPAKTGDSSRWAARHAAARYRLAAARHGLTATA